MNRICAFVKSGGSVDVAHLLWRATMRKIIALLFLFFILVELTLRLYTATKPRELYTAYEAIDPTAFYDTKQVTPTWEPEGFWTVASASTPNPAARHVYLLGTSVMLGVYNRPSETIPAALRPLLPSYQVLNLGAGGQLSTSMYRQAKTLPLAPGDVVVMESITQDAFSVYEVQAKNAGRCAALAIAQFLCQPRVDQAMSAGFAQETLFAVRSTRAYAQAHGAGFLYVIAPYFYSVPPQTRREKQIDGSSDAGITAVYRNAWTAMHDRLIAESDVLDLSHALDSGRLAGRDFYFDIWHFNAQANTIVARAIYAALFGAF